MDRRHGWEPRVAVEAGLLSFPAVNSLPASIGGQGDPILSAPSGKLLCLFML